MMRVGQPLPGQALCIAFARGAAAGRIANPRAAVRVLCSCDGRTMPPRLLGGARQTVPEPSAAAPGREIPIWNPSRVLKLSGMGNLICDFVDSKWQNSLHSPNYGAEASEANRQPPQVYGFSQFGRKSLILLRLIHHNFCKFIT